VVEGRVGNELGMSLKGRMGIGTSDLVTEPLAVLVDEEDIYCTVFCNDWERLPMSTHILL
jgi:hypothetical protein